MTATDLRAGLVTRGDRPLLFDLHERSQPAIELVENVDRLAGAIIEAARPGAKVGLWYSNSLAAVEAFLAVEWVAGTRVAVDPGASEAEAKEIFQAAEVDLVLTDVDRGSMLPEYGLVHDDTRPLGGKPYLATDPTSPNQTYLIYPRSVSNGELFGISLSYANWQAIIDTNTALYRSGRYGKWDEASEVFLSAQQIMHGTGMLGLFPFLSMGLPQVIVDSFDAEKVLQAIERYRVTGTFFVPAMLRGVIGAIEGGTSRASSLRHLLYGGGPVSSDEILRAITCVGPVLSQVYGRVEGGWPISVLTPADHAGMSMETPDLFGSCGRPIEEVETRLRSLPGEPDNVGELQVKNDMTSSEYTASDGWCSVGDVMRTNSQGYLFYQRRLDRMINTGYHVYPNEIEAVIASIAGVTEVAVIGEPHEKWGEMVVAYVVSSGEVSDAELVEKLTRISAERLAKYKVPRRFSVVGELPKSVTAARAS